MERLARTWRVTTSIFLVQLTENVEDGTRETTSSQLRLANALALIRERRTLLLRISPRARAERRLR